MFFENDLEKFVNVGNILKDYQSPQRFQMPGNHLTLTIQIGGKEKLLSDLVRDF